MLPVVLVRATPLIIVIRHGDKCAKALERGTKDEVVLSVIEDGSSVATKLSAR